MSIREVLLPPKNASMAERHAWSARHPWRAGFGFAIYMSLPVPIMTLLLGNSVAVSLLITVASFVACAVLFYCGIRWGPWDK